MNTTSLNEFFKTSELTEQEMANQLGISLTYVYMLKRGDRRPSPELAREISKITGIPLEKLLFPEGENNPAAV